MNTKKIRGLTSIIVPCWSQLAFTKQCIAALKSHTRQPWELVVIDNGSTDHTDIYLAGVQDDAAVPVTVISNTTNLGFPAAINQGLKAARGEYLVLLNNDVVVTDGWLEQLIALAESRGPIGLVGPMSKFGAKVFDFVWIDDFAAARNEALAHATGDYAFWLDADDVVEPGEREKLRALLAGPLWSAARLRYSLLGRESSRNLWFASSYRSQWRRLRRALRVRTWPRRDEGPDGCRSRPALSTAPGRALDVSRS